TTAAAFVVVARRVRRPRPRCSIVITTCDQPARLADCFAALEAAPPEISTEVIVVDNAIALSAAETLAGRRAGFDWRVVTGTRPGYGAGANSGLRQATGEFVRILHDPRL